VEVNTSCSSGSPSQGGHPPINPAGLNLGGNSGSRAPLIRFDDLVSPDGLNVHLIDIHAPH